MFQGYSQETVDFMWGIRFNNERGWFLAHKDDYQQHLLAPTRELGQTVYDGLAAALPHEPLILKVSRIYRDARRLHGQGPYKDHLWFCVRTGDQDWTGRPGHGGPENPPALLPVFCRPLRRGGVSLKP